MKIINNIFSIITLLFFIVTTGCVNEAFEMESTGVSKTITIKGAMPGEKTGTRVIISHEDGSLDLTAVWHPLDLVTFYFVQGNTVIMGGQTVVSDISVDGKKCSLVITIPQGVDSEKSFDLYGFTGAETHLKDGEILVDVTPNLNRKINNISAPVWFVKKGVTVTTTELAVNFDHLGAYEIVHLKNNTSGEFLFKECGLVAKSTGNKEWAYLSLPEAENSTQVPYFKPISGTVEMHTEQRNTSEDIGDLLIISPGRTLAVVSWYMPKDMNLPDLQLLLKADGLDKISGNEKQAKDFGMEKGNAYHVYVVWDGNELSITANDFEVGDVELPYITMTTARAIGETLHLSIGAAVEDRPNVWIDLNNNGVKDNGEQVTSFGPSYYKINSNNITIYGNVTELDCFNNQLTSLDVSNNTVLTRLNCSDNPLSSLNVSNNTSLTELDCSFTQLTSLDVSNNTALTELYFGDMELTSLNVSNNRALKVLYCWGNLTTLDVSNNTALTVLHCSGYLTALDVSNNKELKELHCEGNKLTVLNISNNTLLTDLYCGANQLTSLDVSKNTALTTLNCVSNKLTTLNVSNNVSLTTLACSGNLLTSLDVSNNKKLTYLHCINNELTTLDLSQNTAIRFLFCFYNQLTLLDISNNQDLETLICHDNLLEKLALNKIFTDLPDVTGKPDSFSKKLNIAGNPGAATANIKIATDKGWNVVR